MEQQRLFRHLYIHTYACNDNNRGYQLGGDIDGGWLKWLEGGEKLSNCISRNTDSKERGYSTILKLVQGPGSKPSWGWEEHDSKDHPH